MRIMYMSIYVHKYINISMYLPIYAYIYKIKMRKRFKDKNNLKDLKIKSTTAKIQPKKPVLSLLVV